MFNLQLRVTKQIILIINDLRLVVEWDDKSLRNFFLLARGCNFRDLKIIIKIEISKISQKDDSSQRYRSKT